MSNDLIINVTSSEIVIALQEDKKLVELNREKNNFRFSVGDIYLGRIKKIMPGLNAAFIDIGFEKDAFLHYLDLGPQFKSLEKYLNAALTSRNFNSSLHHFEAVPDIDKHGKISHVLSQGKEIIVQIAKEPISTKGPRLSSEISIAGRNLVLIPFSDKVSISQKIKSNEERNRLKNFIQSIKPDNYGIIARTVSEGKNVEDLDTELRELVDKWESAFKTIRQTTPPRLLIGELDRTSTILRDMLNSSFSSIQVNDEIIYNDIRDYIKNIAPEKEKIVRLYNGDEPIFDQFGIEKQIKSLFGKTVPVSAGAYLIVEHTEALHVIDVNSGHLTKSGKDQETNALEVNIAAAEEIARQLRLRDMGGIIVIDFIDMHDPDHKRQVFEKMIEFMQNDRAKHHILPLSRFGIMQITRQRVRPEMNIVTKESCPACGGKGEIGPSILLEDQLENNFSYIIQKVKGKITLKVHPYIASYLTKGFFSIRTKWRWRYKRSLKIKASASYHFLEYHFFDEKDAEIVS
jgi:ribonuclease G